MDRDSNIYMFVKYSLFLRMSLKIGIKIPSSKNFDNASNSSCNKSNDKCFSTRSETAKWASLPNKNIDEVTGLSNQIEYIDKEQLIKDSERKGSKTIEWRDQIAVGSNNVFEKSVWTPIAYPYKT